MAKNIKGESPSSSEPLEDFDLDEALPPLDEGMGDETGDEATASSVPDSTVNLDEYGIWVKTEPEDFKAVDSFDDQAMELEDLSLDDTAGEAGLPASESNARNEVLDEGLMDDLDLPEEESLAESESAASQTMSPEAAEGEQAMTLADEEIPTLDDELSSLEEEPATVETVFRDEPAPASSTPAAGSFEEPDAAALEAGGDFEDVSLDDLGIEISADAPEEEAAKIAAKRKPAAAPAPTPSVHEDEAHVIDDDFASLSLDLDAEHDGVPSGEPADELAAEKGSLELEELVLPDEEPIGAAEEESLTLETTEAAAGGGEFEDLTESETLEEMPELEIGNDEPIDLEIETDEGGEEIEVPLSDDVSIAENEEELDDLADGPAVSAPAAAGSDSVLRKIEEELRSIKTELTQLKSELGQLKGGQAAPEGRKAKAVDSSDAGGDFFKEEEDETIALTGEELDNILTTADIKEEDEAKAAPEKPEEPEEPALDLGEDIIGYDEGAAIEIESDESEKSAAPTAEAAPEEIGFVEMESEPAASAGEGEIEIEIPELDSELEEAPAPLPAEDLESLEDLGPGDNLDTSDGLSFDDTLESVGDLELESEPEATPPSAAGKSAAAGRSDDMQLPAGLKEEIKSVLGYMDQLLESLPEEKIEEFAKSEYFSIYKKLFEELGLVS